MNGATEGFFLGDSGMYARIFRPHGSAKSPLVIIFHGIPGNETNLDLAYALRENGYAVLVPHYNGCWGSKGEYRIEGIPENAEQVFAEAFSKEFIEKWNIDENRVGVVGHSLGGWVSLISPKISKKIRGIIALDPLADFSKAPEAVMLPVMESFAVPLHNVTPEQLLAGWIWAGEHWNPKDTVRYLEDRFFMVISASGEDCFPIEPVYNVYKLGKSHARKSAFWVIDSDHSFVSQRPRLREIVIEYLNENL
jgi:uncharacterized protein